MKTLGVLGGMGPAATVAFLARVQALTPAANAPGGGDQDHIRVVMDLNPQVPDRNRTPELAEAVLGEMARRLAAAGAQVLAMPCNTAHAQKAGIVAVGEAGGPPFIDMIAETAAAAIGAGVRRVGVLATPGGETLYAAALGAAGIEVVLLRDADRETFMTLVYGVKRGAVGADARAGMARLARVLVAAGAEAIVAGCTEVPLLLGPGDVGVELIDSAEVLAQACVRACDGACV